MPPAPPVTTTGPGTRLSSAAGSMGVTSRTLTFASPSMRRLPSSPSTIVSKERIRSAADLARTRAVTRIRSPTRTAARNRRLCSYQSAPGPGSLVPITVDMNDAVNMPCTTRRPNGVRCANASSTCSGLLSPVRRAKLSRSASVTACSTAATAPTSISANRSRMFVMTCVPARRPLAKGRPPTGR